ncbi:TadA family conjugal transfer-associated ATPase [Streptomyces sp. TLI_171]|uniref:TadA family conjugal transfer-associated ATPase n=1 Tax=Streptomyces sp. TLI_171 TaxID=1938859 RepID=UPI000C590C7D|nr:TadA family conjugal transfer-associated ATPase [Streptomyces sp. TLI_171]RKE19928.1 pilus assembly protein CpaF [Streptomyces sp. TLI_171]
MTNRLHAVDTQAAEPPRGAPTAAGRPIARTHRRIAVPRARTLFGAPPGPVGPVEPAPAEPDRRQAPPVRYLVRRQPPTAPPEDGPPPLRPAPAAPPDSGAAELVDAVRIRLAEAGAPPTAGSVAAALRAARPPLGGADVLDAVRTLRAEIVGAGPLDPLLAEAGVTDVLVNGPDRIWVDRGHGLERAPQVRFPNADAVRRLAHRLATAAGRRLDDARPWVDARLADGTRLHAVLPPIAADCTHISLRTSRRTPFTLAELVAAGALPPAGADLLAAVLRARLSLLISGGTGSGKTTLLAALLGLVPDNERIVLAEDSAELRPDHPHVVRLQSRPPNQESQGELTLRDLVRQALRMRPDRLVVGEVRGAEVIDLLAALNTGHEGGCGTVHANTATDVPARLEALGSIAGLDRHSLHSQLRAGLDAVVHLGRDRADGRRRVTGLHLLVGDRDGLTATTAAVHFERDGRSRPGPGWSRLRELCADRGVDLPPDPEAAVEPPPDGPEAAVGPGPEEAP